ncbi:MAG: hypothetical protein J7J31_03800 [Helicobacteraceae bacterium]|nr:hypothetical protein [Helicobacteraceae bacterium]
MGWIEIINKIEDELRKDKNLPIEYGAHNNIIATSFEPVDLAYLKTAYKASHMGIEKDHHGLAVYVPKTTGCRTSKIFIYKSGNILYNK